LFIFIVWFDDYLTLNLPVQKSLMLIGYQQL